MTLSEDCLFVCLFVWGVNKASQEGALQRRMVFFIFIFVLEIRG
jgi:hypothetical protein